MEEMTTSNGSFVFVEQGQQNRDKFMPSGQNVAIKGQTVGFYLWRTQHMTADSCSCRQTPPQPETVE
jgi:predicted extracellular nuclease